MVGDGADLGRVVRRTTLLVIVLRSLGIGGVEVGLHVRDGHDSVPVRGSSGPRRVAVAPVVEEDAAAFPWDVLPHLVEEFTVDVKGNAVQGPVEAVLVEQLVGSERKLLNNEAIGSLSSEAVGNGFRALENEVYGALGIVELVRKEFHVDFLGVVVVL